MIPGEMAIEKVHGLQCTTMSLSERFTLMAAEYLRRSTRGRRRGGFGNNQKPTFRWFVPNQMTLRMQQTLRQQPVKQRLGMPALRRFGSDGNLPGLQRSNSFGNMNQFRNRIPWRQSNGNLSRSSSVSNLSRASWHGRGGVMRRGGRIGQLRGRLRTVGWQQAGWRHAGQQAGQQSGQQRGARARGGARGRGRGRSANRSQQYRLQLNNNQQTSNLKQSVKTLPTKEELDAQLDEYMAMSQVALDRELDEYMLKGSLAMDLE